MTRMIDSSSPSRRATPRILPVGLALVLLPLPGCATILGTVLSPITVPIDLARCYHPSETWQYLLAPVSVPVFLGLAPLWGCLVGIEADLGFIENGHYAEPPIQQIFRPVRYMPGH